MIECFKSVSVVIGLFGFVAASATLVHCGKSKGNDSADVELEDSKSSYSGMAFTTVDQGLTSSALSYAKFATGEVHDVSTGESGDPLITWLGGASGQLWLFNRGATRLNFRTVDPRADGASPSAETATPSAKTGDPHAALLLEDDRLVLGLNTAGKVLVLNAVTGKVAADAGAKLATPTGEAGQLRPIAFWERTGEGDSKEIWMLNQGLDGNYAFDGSQAIYLLNDDGKGLTATDLGTPDEAASLARGLALHVTNPVAFLEDDADHVYIVGICYAGQTGCHQGVERLDAQARKVELVYDADDADFTGNGAVVDAGEGAFFLQALQGEAKVVLKVESTTKSATVMHTYPDASSGCCALSFDKSSASLYVGDRHADGTGEYQIYRNGSDAPITVSLPGIPYQAVFVPAAPPPPRLR